MLSFGWYLDFIRIAVGSVRILRMAEFCCCTLPHIDLIHMMIDKEEIWPIIYIVLLASLLCVLGEEQRPDGSSVNDNVGKTNKNLELLSDFMNTPMRIYGE